MLYTETNLAEVISEKNLLKLEDLRTVKLCEMMLILGMLLRGNIRENLAMQFCIRSL